MLSKCGSCGGFLFELVEQSPSGSAIKINFIQCSSCGVPIGTVDYFDVGSTVTRIESKINSMSSQVEQLSWDLERLERKLE